MLEDFKQKYRIAPLPEKLIYWNVGIFAFTAIYSAMSSLFSESRVVRGRTFIDDWFALPENLDQLIYKPWTFFTSLFLHAGIWHLLFNMFVLYFSGRIFLTFFNDKQFRNFYFLGGVVGGLSFVLAYNIFPAFANQNQILVGASAAITAILIGAATKAPDYSVRLIGSFVLKLWVLAVLMIIIFIASVPSANAGGEIAHLGGALTGFLYARSFDKGSDFDDRFGRFMDKIVSFFSFRRKTKLKTVHRRKSSVGGHTKKEFDEFNSQKQVDIILDKINKSGYESLTQEEKDILYKAGKK